MKSPLQYTQQQAYGHADRVFDVAFHPASTSVLASASEDCTVRVWRREESSGKHKQVLCCYGHEAEVLRLGWSLDGRLLASGSADNTVRVWDVPLPGVNDQGGKLAATAAPSYKGHQVALLSGHPEEVYHCEFVIPGHPTPPHVTPWTHTTPQPTPHLDQLPPSSEHQPHATAPAAAVSACEQLGPGSHLLAASSESLLLWDLEQGVLTQKADAPGTSGSTVPAEAVTKGYKHAYIFACCRQPPHPSRGQQGGQMVACACSDGVLRLWVLMQSGLQYVGCRQLTDGGGAFTLTAMAWNTHGTLLAVAVKDGTVLVLDTRQQLQVSHRAKLPCSALTAATLPATSPLLADRQGAPKQELLLLGCSDGKLRLCAWQAGAVQGGGAQDSVMELGPPNPTSGFSMLALAVSAAGDALAMAGTATAQPPAEAPAATASGRSSHPGTSDGGASGGGSSSSDGGAQPPPPPQQQQQAVVAGTSNGAAPLQLVTAAPSRRRRGGSGSGRAAAGAAGGAALDALQALDAAVGDMQLDPLQLQDQPQPAYQVGSQGLQGSGAGGVANGQEHTAPGQGGGDGVASAVQQSQEVASQAAGGPAGSAVQQHSHPNHGQRQETPVRSPIFVWCPEG